ncbi:hypothetical protein PACTADRAFT_37303 [Pachysolen tannophilus NRRL Y-2460]|uniref:GH16 domain-containing protein n=1 Tax=Pachysolen tannophilus NRRL Y-2460 TaxID=669874 RepID=A0A1E4U0V9_PACTA|nr:hypothetical protein PACTADRAFT_37303 [Pachysolen tannophilus NRRL Y-2460]
MTFDEGYDSTTSLTNADAAAGGGAGAAGAATGAAAAAAGTGVGAAALGGRGGDGIRNSATESQIFNPTTPNDFTAANFLNASGHTNGLTPPEFDRYPSAINSSRVLSYASAGSRSSLLQHLNRDDSSLSDRSTNPLLIDADFSPFGGYPASSFPLHIEDKEPDDYLHNPDPIADAQYDKNRFLYDLKSMDKRSAGGVFGFLFMIAGAIAVFVILPLLTYTGIADTSTVVESEYTVLTDYTYPQLSAIRTSLVDPDTPDDVYSRTALDGSEWTLVFSDEFNAEGRTFYDGDDQFWYAADLNYAATEDLEWYDPDAVTTGNGTVKMRMDAFKNHDLFYRSGMLHSWNRLCFTQGVLEISARFPNYGNVTGLWPGLWSMGNLGRPGYMATTYGVWPYSYEACDVGITPNQSSPDGISYLPGQRLNSCTCEGDEHPNPGTGRGAPEIDIIEGEMDTTVGVGVASQSLQIAPMDIWYYPDYNFTEIYNFSITTMNTYTGGPNQQAVSATTTLNTTWYELGSSGVHDYQKYAYEYLNDDDDGYVRWFVGDDPTFTVRSYALSPNGNIDFRRISKEPMSIIMNLGISNNWAYIDWPSIAFPVTLSVDYVRIYQPNDSISLTCDPDDYPTYDYIEAHPDAYEDYNKTTWTGAGYTIPGNKLVGC